MAKIMRYVISLIILAALIIPLSASGQVTIQSPTHSALSDPLAPPRPEPLRVAHDAGYWPFSFKDKSSYVGFDLELWAALATEMDVEYELVPMYFKDIIPALESGQINVAIAAIPVTQQRSELVSFSIPYYRNGLQVLCRKGEEITKIEDLKNKTVALEKGSLAEDYANEHLSIKKIQFCSYHEEMFFELLAGRVDAIIADYSILRAYLTITQNPNLVIAPPFLRAHNLAIALPKDSPHIKDLNKALQTYRTSQEYKNLCQKWFGETPNLNAK